MTTNGPRVALLDYGSGNLRSAQRALEKVGARVELTSEPRTATEAQALVVPGVGAFAACMAGLESIRGPRIIGERLAGSRPVLGICVGRQEIGRASCREREEMSVLHASGEQNKSSKERQGVR